MTPRDRAAHPHLPLRVGLSIPAVLALAGALLPSTGWAPPWLWGVDPGAWLPRTVGPVLPLAALLVVWLPGVARRADAAAHRADAVLLARRTVAYGLVPVVGLAAFWLGRDPTHMLGDGRTLAVMLARGDLFHGFDFMTYHLLARILGLAGEPTRTAAFQVMAAVSCAAGGAWLGAAAWSARRLAPAGAGRFLLYGLLVATPTLLLFCGYAEVYAPLAVALLVFATRLVLHREGRGTLRGVAVAWAAALLLHLDALFLAPLLLVAAARARPGDRVVVGRRLWTAIWPAAAALVVALAIMVAAGRGFAGLGRDFGGTGGGEGVFAAVTGRDGLLAVRHLKDIANLWLLLAAVPLVLALRGRRGDPVVRALLGGGAAWLVLLSFVLHLKLGAVRDWDLFAPQVPLVIVAGWYAVTGGEDAAPGIVGPALAVAVALTAPWLALNLSAPRALARIEAAGADLAPYPRGLLHEQLAYYFQAAGDTVETTRNYRLAGVACPDNPRFHAIYGTWMLNRGDRAAATAAYDRALAADSTYVYGLRMEVTVRGMEGDYAGVLPYARRLHRLRREDPASAQAHGVAAERAGLVTEAIAAYGRAVAEDPSRLDVLERRGGLLLRQRRYAEAEADFRRLRAAAPERRQAALGLADSIWLACEADPAAQTGTATRARLTEVVALLDGLLGDGRGDPDEHARLSAWREEVRRRMEGAGHR